MSVNLPISTQVVGARASRSTHPRTLQLLQRVVSLVAQHDISVDNPFIWQTKAEVVRELRQSPQGDLIRLSISCSRTRAATRKFQPHCGTCIQCLQRRISTLGGGASDVDEKDGYGVDLMEDPRNDGEDRAMVLGAIRLALDCAELSDAQFLSRFAAEYAQIAQAYSPTERDDVAQKLIAVLRRHGQTVREILIAAVERRASAVIEKTLPPTSLLALVLKSQLGGAESRSAESPPRKLPEPENDQDAAAGLTNQRFIAVDEPRQQIRISGIAPLGGTTIFPIMRRLIEMATEDQAEGLLPKNHRCRLGKQLADDVGLTDEGAARAAIRRAREEITDGFAALEAVAIDKDAVIESVQGKGYRLNPEVVVVSLGEMKKL